MMCQGSVSVALFSTFLEGFLLTEPFPNVGFWTWHAVFSEYGNSRLWSRRNQVRSPGLLPIIQYMLSTI